MTGTRTVQVVSEHHEGGGGFWWFPESVDADINAEFDREVECWAGSGATIRLVEVEVPSAMSDDEVTDYIDSELLDEIEANLPAIREART